MRTPDMEGSTPESNVGPDAEPDAGSDGRGWNSARLDLPAYLDRLGHDGPLDPTAETLRRLHRAHIHAIPFENLDIVLGRPIRVDLPSVQDKLVRRRRGGYCYEHNSLFAAALERLGYEVGALAVRVRMGSDKIRPATHAALRVVAEGRTWLADVGFGGGGLLEPVELKDGAEARQGEWTVRLDREDVAIWVLRSWTPHGWLDVYSFGLDPSYPVDFAVSNHYVSTHPRSPFVARLVVQRYSDRKQVVLTDDTLTVTLSDGTRDSRRVEVAEVATLLTDELGVALDREEVDGILRYAEKNFPAS
ncbi:N-hydroxyarylamine O-acetyltransferase [Streptoalloteichus tenebrarius]|uniref:N-hydroxyarylamine O-acetyltransferase n=1 Tax=Streptoalloteichus tenebrarius (strain ATCC 17920 / DSM 40477 / JCM 4838 / CBS 697.72 / NBRC 16177 / NCIMB 11028 / NRRL B-12390 / A12253. 1 / ISP 5477) TaxID=1933 RepID=A0ABT1HMR1_STRSD|nr:arylamine N-acetyltransferase [Streptoalloteichus tenebrarius]MCP2256795.1 N-hydroxyarylamine O-acetyltransferase [Streptoalloteichus tenebrarius]BFF00299.1 arylamine N-acetyltransferase [Streptoalloteichus tenebrarius]